MNQYHLAAARLNPLGLIYVGRLMGRARLYESGSDIAKQNFIGFGAVGAITPAWGRIGVGMELQPLTILKLHASYELMGFFGNFDYMASFSSPNQEYGPDSLSARATTAGTEAYVTAGSWITLGATLQLKVGPIAIRSLFRIIRSNFELRDGDTSFYEPINDLIVPNRGWFLSNDVDAFYLIGLGERSLAIGARWTYSAPLFQDRHYADGEDPDSGPRNDIHRLGLIAAFTLWNRPGARFNKPTFILISQWHLHHRYRTGQEVAQAVPYFGIGFRVSGDVHTAGR